MLELAERAYFRFCLALGGLLRASRYSSARIVDRDGKAHVRKHRRFYAPLLVWLGDPLVVMLDTGVRVLHRAEWEERERQMYSRLYGLSIRVESGGVLLLPHLVGVTLASLLEDPLLDDSVRTVAIERAVVALARLHRSGFTHGDAMAENVLLDLEAGVARWFDFETVHDLGRPIAWRRADDVRALLATCVVRTEPQRIPETVDLILSTYGDEDVSRVTASSFRTALQRPLSFHLGQAPLSFESFRAIGRLLHER